MSDANSFVGAGWHWPLTTDQTGAVALVRGTTELEQAMYLRSEERRVGKECS